MESSTLREDIELFRSVMWVLNALEGRDLDFLGQSFPPLLSGGVPPGAHNDSRKTRPETDTEDEESGDEDRMADDEDEMEDDDSEDDDESDSDEIEEVMVNNQSVDGDEYDHGEESEEEEDEDDSETDDSSEFYEELQSLADDPIVSSYQEQATSTATPSQGPVIASGQVIQQSDADLRCWEHGCNGRKFTNRSNLRRHLREKSTARPTCRCPRCGATFSRTTARNVHVARGSCNRIRRYSNGRIRPNQRIQDEELCWSLNSA
ncbi:hypothetical protein PFICI_00147 [Pestalotiopsis fici W106-1]|uniref:C2H2-type domain-containing protein n=1 Tax=Pestalotiopsis fici (strain W106-1 / CGMCC3.15140) TaxID=1229662 RepID=W3XJX1_PESFW|nr:uncharacterized protein PFICI_00147 [Pestalotiopsis fici W106-1]ETS86319.1 hypothetical protein PFICI_00147 [Pestalotiopsis fici W106-1]